MLNILVMLLFKSQLSIGVLGLGFDFSIYSNWIDLVSSLNPKSRPVNFFCKFQNNRRKTYYIFIPLAFLRNTKRNFYNIPSINNRCHSLYFNFIFIF